MNLPEYLATLSGEAGRLFGAAPWLGIIWWILMFVFFVGAVVISYWIGQGITSLIKSINRLAKFIFAHKYPKKNIPNKNDTMPILSDSVAKHQ